MCCPLLHRRNVGPNCPLANARLARTARSPAQVSSTRASSRSFPLRVGPVCSSSPTTTRHVSACSPGYARVARTAAPPREFPSRARQPDLLSLPRGSRVPASSQPDRATCPCCPPHTRVSRALSLSARLSLPRASNSRHVAQLCSISSPAREWPADTCPTLQKRDVFLPRLGIRFNTFKTL